VLSSADREAFAYFRGSVAAVFRARAAVVAGAAAAAGVAVPDFLVTGWAGARPVSVSTLERAFTAQLTPAERAMWRDGDQGAAEALRLLVDADADQFARAHPDLAERILTWWPQRTPPAPPVT
jgi:hypothetical protein